MERKHVGRFLSLLLAGGLLAGPTAGRAATLVEKGQPRAVIVLPVKASPAAARAARVFQDHIKQMSGAELPIRTEDQVADAPTKDQAWILVGEGTLAAKQNLTSKGLGAGGVHLSAKGQVVALFGPDAGTPSDPDGTRYAVTTFLEDKLGVRYLWPGELGKVIPRQETIAVDDFEYRFTPKLGQRRIRSLSYHDRLQVGLDGLGFTKADYEKGVADTHRTASESPDWFGWQRLGGTLNINGGHAFTQLWAKSGKEHPEWFALQPDGTRDQSTNPERAQLCFSNPGLVEEVAREKIAELTRNPALLGVSIAPNDGGRPSFCSCPKCEALDAAGGRKVLLWDFTKGKQRTFEHVSLTDRMVWFWNAVAERVAKVHPDKLLVVDSYSVYAAPPVERKLHPNLVVRFGPLGYHSDEYRKESLRDWDGWSKAAGRIYFRPNLMLSGRRDGLPLVYVHKFAEDFRYLAGHGMMGTDFDSCCHNWATQGLNYYVVARLHWNPEQDVNAIVDDFCKTGFGPAAGPVRRYFDRLEGLMNETAAKDKKAASVFTPEALAGLRKELEQAKRAVGDAPAFAGRVAFLERGLRWTEVEAGAHALLADPAAVDKTAAKKALDERYTLMQELFRKTPSAVNVAYVAWGEDAQWSRLGWSRPRKP
ncbi:DUF4838 domain-containing protein [Fimbriiglobus ruber]|uniref:Beta-hexosaminidase, GH20 family n=1 Tax=Fimbriiglobus ruber TaxID=1908690 RepID=A0A225DN32_9BACT|nr:DUF4838 domain-containing protein [Fimbriiglobus ruber]OWK41094.1 beta-hexosaminidase, GH20 family [Fimbriiglobus ruber]